MTSQAVWRGLTPRHALPCPMCVDTRQEDHASHRAQARVVHATVRRTTCAGCSLGWLSRETTRQASRAGATEACGGATGGDHGAREVRVGPRPTTILARVCDALGNQLCI